MAAGSNHFSRYEMKYLITEQSAEAIYSFISSYVVKDKFFELVGGIGYKICSLYLDSPSLALYRATQDGLRNRFKLRIRFYENNPDSPLFFEIKRRIYDTIVKDRTSVRRDAVDNLLNGQLPRVEDLYEKNGSGLAVLHQFCELQHEIHASGVAYVSYRRQAFAGDGADNVRITFDRELEGRNFNGKMGFTDDDIVSRPPYKGVILEIKYRDWMPPWLVEMVRTFNLQRCSVPKYVNCIESISSSPHRIEKLLNWDMV